MTCRLWSECGACVGFGASGSVTRSTVFQACDSGRFSHFCGLCARLFDSSEATFSLVHCGVILVRMCCAESKSVQLGSDSIHFNGWRITWMAIILYPIDSPDVNKSIDVYLKQIQLKLTEISIFKVMKVFKLAPSAKVTSRYSLYLPT